MAHGGCLPALAIGRAVQLAATVHEEGPREVAAVLTPMSRQDLYGVAVALAAMVPIDYSPGELLAWNDMRFEPDEDETEVLFPARDKKPLLPHGTHSAFNRHRNAGEEPCEACRYGERLYQRERGRRRRAQREQVA